MRLLNIDTNTPTPGPEEVMADVEGASSFAPVDAYRTSRDFIVRCDLPGVNPESVSVALNDRTLKLSAARAEEDEKENVWISERPTGLIGRSLELPVDVDASKGLAEWNEGTLTLTLPIIEEIFAPTFFPSVTQGPAWARPFRPEPLEERERAFSWFERSSLFT